MIFSIAQIHQIWKKIIILFHRYETHADKEREISLEKKEICISEVAESGNKKSLLKKNSSFLQTDGDLQGIAWAC